MFLFFFGREVLTHVCCVRKYQNPSLRSLGSSPTHGMLPKVTATLAAAGKQKSWQRQKVAATEAKLNGHTTFMMGSKVAQCGGNHVQSAPKRRRAIHVQTWNAKRTGHTTFRMCKRRLN